MERLKSEINQILDNNLFLTNLAIAVFSIFLYLICAISFLNISGNVLATLMANCLMSTVFIVFVARKQIVKGLRKKENLKSIFKKINISKCICETNIKSKSKSKIKRINIVPKELSPIEIVYSLLVIISLCIVSQYVARFVMRWDGTNLKEYYGSIKQNIHLFLLLTLFFAPLGEEILFRGIVFNYLRRGCDKKTIKVLVYILSAGAFAMMHGTLAHFFGAFFSAIFFNYIYEKTNKLKYPILFHFVFNFTALISPIII